MVSPERRERQREAADVEDRLVGGLLELGDVSSCGRRRGEERRGGREGGNAGNVT